MTANDMVNKWRRVKELVRKENSLLFGVLHDVRPVVEKECVLVLYVRSGYDYHMGKISEHSQFLRKCIISEFGDIVTSIEVDFDRKRRREDDIKEHRSFVAKTMNIFDSKCRIVSQNFLA